MSIDKKAFLMTDLPSGGSPLESPSLESMPPAVDPSPFESYISKWGTPTNDTSTFEEAYPTTDAYTFPQVAPRLSKVEARLPSNHSSNSINPPLEGVEAVNRYGFPGGVAGALTGAAAGLSIPSFLAYLRKRRQTLPEKYLPKW